MTFNCILKDYPMIKHPDITSRLDEHPVLFIKDSLLNDALGRNELTKPPRPISPRMEEHPVSKLAYDDGEPSAF